jgi:hypothetical protein
MYRKLIIPLSQKEQEALQKVADGEMRGLADQARFLVRQELEKRGLIEQPTIKSNTLEKSDAGQ